MLGAIDGEMVGAIVGKETLSGKTRGRLTTSSRSIHSREWHVVKNFMLLASTTSSNK